jgi:hypothetical protein
MDNSMDVIIQANILRMNDLSPPHAKATAGNYGLLGNEAFIEYILNLGLVTYNGRGVDKPSVSIIKKEAKKRGW